MTTIAQPNVGDYLVNRATRVTVEIMDIALSGDYRVLDIRADIDAPWDRLTTTQIQTDGWERIDR